MTDALSRRTLALTIAALCAFAANSLLCRAALGLRDGVREIDAATFTSVRLVSGALALWILARAQRVERGGGSWRGALALAGYALAFSFAYVRIAAGVGALILFGSVQATMLASALARRERLRAAQAWGLALALAGLAWLVLPGAGAPDALGAALMVLAGIAWGVYSLLGRGNTRPLASTAQNFVWSVPFALAASAIDWHSAHASVRSFVLASASGAIASGLGYTIWYAALRGLTTTAAAIAQLSVPILAAAGAVVLLGETLHPRLLGCAALVLGGIALALLVRRR